MKMILMAAAMTALTGRSEIIQREDWRGDWPFTVRQVTLTCYKTGPTTGLVTAKAGGKEYALNGLARAHFESVEPIRARWNLEGAEGTNLKVPLSDLITRGLRLCS